MGAGAHWLWHKDSVSLQMMRIYWLIYKVPPPLPTNTHSHKRKDRVLHCMHRSITRLLTHTSLTILLHVMYSMSGHDASNCCTHSCIIKINYLAAFYDGATVITGWQQVTEMPIVLQAHLNEKWELGEATRVGLCFNPLSSMLCSSWDFI